MGWKEDREWKVELGNTHSVMIDNSNYFASSQWWEIKGCSVSLFTSSAMQFRILFFFPFTIYSSAGGHSEAKAKRQNAKKMTERVKEGRRERQRKREPSMFLPSRWWGKLSLCCSPFKAWGENKVSLKVFVRCSQCSQRIRLNESVLARYNRTYMCY